MDSGYLCNLTFILSKFTLKNFLFLEMMSITKHFPIINWPPACNKILRVHHVPYDPSKGNNKK